MKLRETCTRQNPAVLAAAVVYYPFPHSLAHPLASFLTICLCPVEQEQAPFTCGEIENGPRRISILAVATVTYSPRSICIGTTINLRITKLYTSSNSNLIGKVPRRCVCDKCLIKRTRCRSTVWYLYGTVLHLSRKLPSCVSISIRKSK